MYIIIVGGGRLGYYLAKALLDEGHEALIIEKNETVCKTIVNEMGSICIHGDGCEAATLDEIGTGRADIFIAVTGDDEDNLIACQVAKHKFNAPRTIARVRNPQNENVFKKLGIDVTVNSTRLILEVIEEEVPTHSLTHLLNIREAGLEIVEIKIPPGSTTIGKPIKELSLPENSRLILNIPKEGQPRICTATGILQAEDRILAITTPESEEALRAVLRGTGE
ncbi:MAG: TrkA family potassium uptake protein [Chloroflexota bacterium]